MRSPSLIWKLLSFWKVMLRSLECHARVNGRLVDVLQMQYAWTHPHSCTHTHACMHTPSHAHVHTCMHIHNYKTTLALKIWEFWAKIDSVWILLDPPKVELTFFCLKNFVSSYAFRYVWYGGMMTSWVVSQQSQRTKLLLASVRNWPLCLMHPAVWILLTTTVWKG